MQSNNPRFLRTALSASVLGALSLSTASIAFARPALPRVVPLPAQAVYVPNGFDDNDNVEVIVHGHLPSTCYKLQDVRARPGSKQGELLVQAFALLYPGPCLQMRIPFTSPVKVGLLKAGNYTVRQEISRATAPVEFRVTNATTESPDDFLYAPVDSAELLPATVDGGEQVLRLRGRYPYMFIGCMQIKDVMTNPQKEILVVQPTAEIVNDPEVCSSDRPETFEIEVPVDNKLPAEFLVHVRSLNGTSYNRHFERVEAGLNPQR